jgi:hypothetical protein
MTKKHSRMRLDQWSVIPTDMKAINCLRYYLIIIIIIINARKDNSKFCPGFNNEKEAN